MDPRAVQWFGESWEAPVCDPEQEIEIPVGQSCARCGREFEDEPGTANIGQGFAIPFIDKQIVDIHGGVDKTAELAELNIWPGEHLYFHRTCFMEVIRG